MKKLLYLLLLLTPLFFACSEDTKNEEIEEIDEVVDTTDPSKLTFLRPDELIGWWISVGDPIEILESNLVDKDSDYVYQRNQIEIYGILFDLDHNLEYSLTTWSKYTETGDYNAITHRESECSYDDWFLVEELNRLYIFRYSWPTPIQNFSFFKDDSRNRYFTEFTYDEDKQEITFIRVYKFHYYKQTFKKVSQEEFWSYLDKHERDIYGF